LSFLKLFPWMAVPVVIYNILALGGLAFSSVEAIRLRLDTDFLVIPIGLSASWNITPGHALICCSIIMLFIEFMKSRSISSINVLSHASSIFIFVISIVEFLIFPAFATSVFFLIMLMCLMDVVSRLTLLSAFLRHGDE
jgi:hypothetical protein